MAPILVLLLVWTLAACSTPHTSTRSTTPASTSTSTTTTPPSSSTAPAAAHGCATGLLRAHASFGGAAAGISYYVVTLTNAGPMACTVDGYPVFRFFGPSGAGGAGAGPALQVSESHAGLSASSVLLRPGGDVESLVLFSDVPVNGAGCPQVASALVYPPGSAESISVPMSLSPCGGVRVDAFGPVGSERP